MSPEVSRKHSTASGSAHALILKCPPAMSLSPNQLLKDFSVGNQERSVKLCLKILYVLLAYWEKRERGFSVCKLVLGQKSFGDLFKWSSFPGDVELYSYSLRR